MGVIIKNSSPTLQVKCQVGYRLAPGNPTQDPRWEWWDPILGGGIPPVIKIGSHLGSCIKWGIPTSHAGS